jgi:hypothetical protein
MEVLVETYHRMRKLDPAPDLLAIKSKLAREHLDRVRAADAVLIVNVPQGYVGGNTFLEIGVAFYFSKKIFLWESLASDLPYGEEILAFEPRIIDHDISLIK